MIRAFLSLFATAEPMPMTARSPRWPGVRATHLRTFPTCAACGGGQGVEVHHVMPVHLYPGGELEPGNLITLCAYRGCHLRVGHAFSWHSFNPHAREDAALLLKRIKERP